MRTCSIFILLSILTSPVFAQSAAPVVLEKIGPARLLAYAPYEDGVVLVRFSGVFKLTVELDGERGLEVDPPSVWTTSEGWKIKDVEGPIVTTHGEKQRWRQSFILDPLNPAVTSFELKPLSYRNGSGSWQTVAWKPITVKIVAQIADRDLHNLRENPGVEDLPTPSPTSSPWPSVVAAVLGLVVLSLVVWLSLRRRTVRRSRTAEEIARYELKRLEDLALPQRQRTGEFHTLLANVVRRYLERRFQLPARRLTTQEFSSLLQQNTLLKAEHKDFLNAFLRQCDLAKFADAQVPTQQCAELCRQTRFFLDSVNATTETRTRASGEKT